MLHSATVIPVTLRSRRITDLKLRKSGLYPQGFAFISTPAKSAIYTALTYRMPPITLRIGPSLVDYSVLRPYLLQYPKLAPSYGPYSYTENLELPELDDDVGHTLVHYLYTGTYQTLKPQAVVGNIDSTTEYRRSVLIYCAARTYGLDGLILLAKDNMGSSDKGLSIFDILGVAREVYPKLSANETWFPDYIKEKIEAAFELDEALFARESFLDGVGKVAAFDKALMKSVVEIYTSKITDMGRKEKGVSWSKPHSVQEAGSVPEDETEYPAEAESVPEPEIEYPAEAESTPVYEYHYSIQSGLVGEWEISATEPAPIDACATEPSLEEFAPTEAELAEPGEVEEATIPSEEPPREEGPLRNESVVEVAAEAVPDKDADSAAHVADVDTFESSQALASTEATADEISPSQWTINLEAQPSEAISETVSCFPEGKGSKKRIQIKKVEKLNKKNKKGKKGVAPMSAEVDLAAGTPETYCKPVAVSKHEDEPAAKTKPASINLDGAAAYEEAAPEAPPACEDATPEEAPNCEEQLPEESSATIPDPWEHWSTGRKLKKNKVKKIARYNIVIADPDPAVDPTIKYSAEAVSAWEPEIEHRFKAETALEPEVENGVCASRARHLLDGDMWKDCKKCRAVIRQVSLQLAREDSRGEDRYEDVGRVLVE